MQLLRRNACCCGIVALGVEACSDDGSRCKDCKCCEITGSFLHGWQGTMWLSFCGRSLSLSGLRTVLPYRPAITFWSIYKLKTCPCGEPHMGVFLQLFVLLANPLHLGIQKLLCIQKLERISLEEWKCRRDIYRKVSPQRYHMIFQKRQNYDDSENVLASMVQQGWGMDRSTWKTLKAAKLGWM